MTADAAGGGGGETTAADLAEQALLGALLWDPRRVRDVAGWLQGEDFRRPAYGAIYQTVTGLLADGRPVDLLGLPQVLAAGEYHDLHAARDGHGPLGAAALHGLLAMTPATPRGEEFAGRERSEHVRYARIVLDASIRRTVQQMGSRVGQHGAQLAGVHSDNAAAHLQLVLADIKTQLDDLAGRQAQATGSTISAVLDPRAGAVAGMTAEVAAGQLPSLGADRPPPTAGQLRAAEHVLVGAAISCPPVRELLAGRVLPTDFSAPAAGATWHAVQSLRGRGEPVDVVLVADEVERQGEVAGLGPGLRPRQLAAMRPDLVQGFRAAEVVLGAALTRAAQRARDQLHELAGDRGGQLLEGARRAVADAHGIAGRLTRTAPNRALAALAPSTPIPTARVADPAVRPVRPTPSPGAVVAVRARRA